MNRTISAKLLLISLSILIVLLTTAGAEVRYPDAAPAPDLTELSPEELMKIEVAMVYGASKFQQKVTEAPSSVTIITADEIRKYGYRTLSDILKGVRSFYMTYDRNYSYINVRGFSRSGDYNNRILLLVDGHRLNDNIYDGASVGTEFTIDIDLIERVEIIRGPGSSLYGSNAFFAVINVITRRGLSLKGVETSAEAGGPDTYKGRFTYGDIFQNGLDVFFSGSLYDGKGSRRAFIKEFASPDTNYGITEHTDYDRYSNYFTKLSYYDFLLEAAYSSRTKGIPTASFSTDFNDPRNRTIDSRGFLDLKYERSAGSKVNVMARLYYDYYEYKGDYIYSGVVNKDWSYGTWWGAELKFTAALLDKHKLILGSEYRDNIRQDQKNYDEDPYNSYFDDRRKSAIWALYIQDELTISGKLILNAGVRRDYYRTFGGTINPRIGLIYNPFENTTFKLLYGSAFRAPNNYELFYQTLAGGQKANPDLTPETIKTYKLVYEQYIGGNFRGTINGFYYHTRDLISVVTDPADNQLVFRNIDEIEAKGLEFEVQGKGFGGLEGRFSYTFQKAQDRKTGGTLINSPRHLAKFNLIAPLLGEKISLGIEEQYMSARKTLAGNRAGAFFITNATLLSRALLKGLDISGSVYNLFNRKYGDPGAQEHRQDIIQQDGRTFRLKLTYKF